MFTDWISKVQLASSLCLRVSHLHSYYLICSHPIEQLQLMISIIASQLSHVYIQSPLSGTARLSLYTIIPWAFSQLATWLTYFCFFHIIVQVWLATPILAVSRKHGSIKSTEKSPVVQSIERIVNAVCFPRLHNAFYRQHGSIYCIYMYNIIFTYTCIQQ